MRIERPQLDEGWSTLFLLMAMMLVAAFAVPQTELTPGLNIIPVVTFFAVILGVLMAKSQFGVGTVRVMAIIFGMFVVFFLVGRTEEFANMSWHERLIDPVDGMITRQFLWFQKLFSGGTSRDGLIFVFQTAVVYWVLGVTAAWYTFRNLRIWFAIVPTGLILFSVVYYYAGPNPLAFYLAAYVLLALLFVARTHLMTQERQWRSGSVRYEKQIWFTFIRAGFIAALIALIFAWLIPPLSANATVGDALSGTRGPWRDFQEGWTRMFSALRTYGSNTADPYQDSLVLGGPRNPGNTPVMDVIVSQKLPYVYWQAITYDTYNDQGAWEIEDVAMEEHFPDDGPINTPYTLGREVITQTVISYFPSSSFIYGAPEIINADRALNIFAAKDQNNNKLVNSVRSKFVLQQGDQYEVTSRLSLADANSLRNASTIYPDWVSETYLDLPDTITPETKDLAAELMAGHDNNFDKAIAVRDYLRNAITYNDQIAAVPEGIDPVHYILFVSQEGYCNYYASAMAVMLRSQGIPSRVVSGFAQGSYDEESRSYRVNASNAHTWVEAYFPDYGWIQFEPTASIPIVARPDNLDSSSAGGDAFGAFVNPLINREELLGEDLNPEEEEDFLNPEDFERGPLLDPQQEGFLQTFPIWQALFATLIVAVAVVLSFVATEMNRRVEGDVDKSYGRLGNWARWLGIHYRPVDTPFERADSLVTAVPEGKEPIRALTNQYVRKQYSPNREDDVNFNPTQEWRQLRPVLLRETIRKQLSRLQRPKKDKN